MGKKRPDYPNAMIAVCFQWQYKGMGEDSGDNVGCHPYPCPLLHDWESPVM